MDKDSVLNLSRKENEKKPGEWETSILNKAHNIGRISGLIATVFLVLADEFLLHTRIVSIAAWIIFFAIDGSTELVLYLHFRKKRKLIWAIIAFICVIMDTISLFFFCLQR